MVHGKEALDRAEKISNALFGGELGQLTAVEIEEGFSDVPSAMIQDPDTSLVEALIQVGAVTSKRQAREAIDKGAIYINDIRHTNIESTISQFELLGGKYLIIRRGKKNYYLIKHEA